MSAMTWKTQGENSDYCEKSGNIVVVLENVVLQNVITVHKKLGIDPCLTSSLDF